MPTQPQRWGILGGGFLGMTLALRLAQSGHRVTLYESAPCLGGLASAWNLEDVVWDRHYHVTLLSDSFLRSLLRELGLEKDLQWVETKTGFYAGGKLYSMSNVFEFLRFPALNLMEKFRLATTILYASKIKQWKRLEEVTAVEWLERCSGRRTLEKIWLPLLRAKLGENYNKASAAFIWAIIVRMYAARKQGLKKEMFGYVPGGYARVLEQYGHALQAAGVEVCLNSAAQEVSTREDGSVEVSFANGKRTRFDQVVLTMAAPMAARICSGLNHVEKNALHAVQYQGIICASVLLKQPLANYYITNITENWVPFTAVIEMSALVDRKHFGGQALVYLPKYVPAASEDFSLPDHVIQEQFVSALERMYPHFRRSDVSCFKISRVRYVLPIPTLHYSDQLPKMQTSLPGVHIVNSVQIVNGTLNVNETVQLAERAARTLVNLPKPAPSVATQGSYVFQ